MSRSEEGEAQILREQVISAMFCCDNTDITFSMSEEAVARLSNMMMIPQNMLDEKTPPIHVKKLREGSLMIWTNEGRQCEVSISALAHATSNTRSGLPSGCSMYANLLQMLEESEQAPPPNISSAFDWLVGPNGLFPGARIMGFGQ